jgi:hypothetical protein
MNEKIFINIASFRDPSLIITIKSALLHAKNPENLVFGVAAQYYDDEFPDFTIAESQIKVIRYNPDTAPGVGKVRYEISQLVTDEKYFLMIDSHTLFFPNWDVSAKSYLKKAEAISGHDKVCIGSTPIMADAPTFLFQLSPEIFEDQRMFFDTQNNLEVMGKLDINWRLEEVLIKEKIFRHHHVVCHTFFTYSSYLVDVGLDSFSSFLHEEPYLSWKTYVSGWDLYRVIDNFTKQCPDAYFNLVWGEDANKRSYVREPFTDKVRAEIDMFAAMILDKQNKFSAKNQTRSSEEFWLFAGEAEKFKKLKNSELFHYMCDYFELNHGPELET